MLTTNLLCCVAIGWIAARQAWLWRGTGGWAIKNLSLLINLFVDCDDGLPTYGWLPSHSPWDGRGIPFKVQWLVALQVLVTLSRSYIFVVFGASCVDRNRKLSHIYGCTSRSCNLHACVLSSRSLEHPSFQGSAVVRKYSWHLVRHALASDARGVRTEFVPQFATICNFRATAPDLACARILYSTCKFVAPAC